VFRADKLAAPRLLTLLNIMTASAQSAAKKLKHRTLLKDRKLFIVKVVTNKKQHRNIE
jgi:hypothetical protein